MAKRQFKFKYIYSEPGTNKLTRVEDNNDNGVVAANLGDIQTGQTGTNYTYHADGSLKSDADACPEPGRREEIAYIDWYPSGKIKRIYRTATSEQSDLYFEYDPMGMRTLKVEITRTGTTINTANNWVYTYYAADANGTTMAIYDLDENDQENTLQKTENMLYGGSRLGIDVEAVTVAGLFIDPTTQCNTDGRASFMLEITGPLLGQPAQDIVIELGDTELANMPNWGGDRDAWVDHQRGGASPCFVAGTQILMADNSIELIENIEAGDTVKTFNLTTQKLENNLVRRVDAPIHDSLVKISFNNDVFNTNTSDHPYFVVNKGWCSVSPNKTFAKYGMKVDELNTGDTCLFFNGFVIEHIIVKSISVEFGSIQTYNLSDVENNNNFFANGILVHNKLAPKEVKNGKEKNSDLKKNSCYE